MRISSCRSCAAPLPAPVLSLGTLPLANSLLSQDRLSQPEPRFPLELVLCPGCGLAQINEDIDPEVIFSDYPYVSSTSETFVRSAEKLAQRLTSDSGLAGDDLVVELGSNDGYLLQFYAQAGVQVLGIDPAANIAEHALARNVPTLVEYFGAEVAQDLVTSGKRARVIHANNVIAHVPDLNGFVEGMATLLRGDGLICVETPYLRNLVEQTQFDTIYHEHRCYYSLTSLVALFQRHGLYIRSFEELPVHGGSLRLLIDKYSVGTAQVEEALQEERLIGIARPEYFAEFAKHVAGVKQNLNSMLRELRASGRLIAGYGASAKGCILLNYCEVDHELLDFVVDRAAEKQGRYMPGVRIPILPPSEVLARQPDYLLLLVWNLTDEVVEQQLEYRRRGGRFIVPVPTARILELV